MALSSMKDLLVSDCRLRPEGLDHRFVRLDVGAADQVDAVRHRGKDPRRVRQSLQRLADRFRLARQIDDQRSEERRVGKEWRSRRSPAESKKNRKGMAAITD